MDRKQNESLFLSWQIDFTIVQNRASRIQGSRPLPQLSVTIATASICIQSFIQNASTSIASSSAWINYRREWVALWLPKSISPTEVLFHIMDKIRTLVLSCTFGFHLQILQTTFLFISHTHISLQLSAVRAVSSIQCLSDYFPSWPPWWPKVVLGLTHINIYTIYLCTILYTNFRIDLWFNQFHYLKSTVREECLVV